MTNCSETQRHQTMQRQASISCTLLITAMLIVMTLLAGCEPKDRRPGTWLSGEVETKSVSDWSFVNEQSEVFIETRPWYGVPFSVTTVIAEADGKVFVPSIYDQPADFPGSKHWNSVIADNPQIRLKVGGKLYEMAARPAANPAEFDQGLSALAAKYDFWRSVQTGESATAFVIIRLHPLTGS
jgi:hypothetical protein